LQRVLRFEAQPTGLRTGGDDDGVGGVAVARVGQTAERPVREIDFGNDVMLDDGANMARLRLHLLHQPRALNDVREARVIFDIRRYGELAAGLHSGDQNGVHVGTGRINRRREARWAGADDQDSGMMPLAHAVPYGRTVTRCKELPRCDKWRGKGQSPQPVALRPL
jgi:hypothetical protein